MKVRYAKNLITGAVEMQSRGTEGNQADLDVMRSNMIGDGTNGLTPSDVEVGWEEAETVEGWTTAFNDGLKTYADHRRIEYPSIADQLDDIYHNGIDAWKSTIKITKDKYPK
tara:strand:+ start:896 stop:1231 length:336 start_codon:yes stop_codon:yes gene_type:complete